MDMPFSDFFKHYFVVHFICIILLTCISTLNSSVILITTFNFD